MHSKKLGIELQHLRTESIKRRRDSEQIHHLYSMLFEVNTGGLRALLLNKIRLR